MDDIYSNFIFDNTSKTTVEDARSLANRRQEKPVHEDYLEGDVTGYAEQHPIHVRGVHFPIVRYFY